MVNESKINWLGFQFVKKVQFCILFSVAVREWTFHFACEHTICIKNYNNNSTPHWLIYHSLAINQEKSAWKDGFLISPSCFRSLENFPLATLLRFEGEISTHTAVCVQCELCENGLDDNKWMPRCRQNDTVISLSLNRPSQTQHLARLVNSCWLHLFNLSSLSVLSRGLVGVLTRVCVSCRYYGNSREHFILQRSASGRFQWKPFNKVDCRFTLMHNSTVGYI